MIGYDFNGVVDTGKYRPTKEDVIITGINRKMAPVVFKYMKEHGILCLVYINPYMEMSKEKAALWKSEMIVRLKCERFYEDDYVQYEYIKNHCQGCEIIKV